MVRNCGILGMSCMLFSLTATHYCRILINKLYIRIPQINYQYIVIYGTLLRTITLYCVKLNRKQKEFIPMVLAV